jgi:hypothetical protein
MQTRRKRVGDPDGNFWCRAAYHGSEFWDWIDKRQIDAHCYSLLILYGTVKVSLWCMDYAGVHADKPALEIAAVIAAIMTPWTALQAAAIKFLFETRTKSYESKP